MSTKTRISVPRWWASAALVALTVPLAAQGVEHAGGWRAALGRARVRYEDAMAKLREDVLTALALDEASLRAAALVDHDECARLAEARQTFLTIGTWPHTPRVENLRPRADAVRAALLGAYEAARDACVRAGASAAAATLEREWSQAIDEVDIAPFGPNLLAGLDARRRTASERPAQWRFDVLAHERYRVELVARRVEGDGPICFEVPSVDGQRWRVLGEVPAKDPVVRLLLSVRAGAVSVDLGAEGAEPCTGGADLPPGTLSIAAPTGRFEIVSLRMKPIARADSRPAATLATGEGATDAATTRASRSSDASSRPAARVDDPFASGRCWDCEWEGGGACVVTVVERSDGAASLRVARANGSEFVIECTAEAKGALQVRAIRHTKVPRGGSRRTLTEVRGAVWVRGGHLSLSFDSRSRSRSKKESFEAQITGEQRTER